MASVQLIGNATDGYQLTVDGVPFFVKGAGLEFGQLAADPDLRAVWVVPIVLEAGQDRVVHLNPVRLALPAALLFLTSSIL